MIASDPQDFVQYVNNLKSEHNLKDDDVKPAREKAQKIVDEKASNKAENEKAANINKYFNELVTLTSQLPISVTGKNTPPIYGPQYNGNYGSLARVDNLSKGHQDGSEAAQIFTDNYRKLNVRKQGSRGFYVRGHLLSEKLGGPGNDWRNLTPLFQNANRKHESDFESKVKTAVSKDEKIENFRVQAIYGRSPSGLIETLKDPNDDSIPAGMNPNYNPFVVAELLEAEAMVPNQLACNAEVLRKDGSKETVNQPVDNPIDYGNLSAYSLDIQPRTDFNLSEEVNKASNEADALINLMVLNGIGKERAKKIYDRVKSNKKITNYYDQINISKKYLEKLNPTKRIMQS